jgi:hypothetical protein
MSTKTLIATRPPAPTQAITPSTQAITPDAQILPPPYLLLPAYDKRGIGSNGLLNILIARYYNKHKADLQTKTNLQMHRSSSTTPFLTYIILRLRRV